jgi:hypothetical protein
MLRVNAGGRAAWGRCVTTVVMVVGPVLGVLTHAAGASAPPSVSVITSNVSPELNSLVRYTECWSRAHRSDLLSMDQLETSINRQRRTSVTSWVARANYGIRYSTGCHVWFLPTSQIGPHQYRGYIHRGTSVLAASRILTEVTYGPISGTQYLVHVALDRNVGLSEVSNGVELFNYFAVWPGSPSTPFALTIPERSTCRSLTLLFLSTDDVYGDVDSKGKSTVILQQGSFSPQSFTFHDNALASKRFVLDGAPGKFTFTNTNSSNLYLLVPNSSADCWTANANVPAPHR